jgi:hypothetical protein
MEFETVLRGLSFRPLAAKEIANALTEGAGLKLEREPFNQFDTNAIKVLDPETEEHLGYVAKEHAIEIARHMDAGHQFECTVTGFMKVGMPILTIHNDEDDADNYEIGNED